MKYFKLLFPVIVLSLLVNNCATIIKGTKQDISINSTPQKAAVVVKTTGGIEVFSGTTPTTVRLEKKKEYVVSISMEGYKEASIQISQSFEAWTIGNLAIGFIGLIIDAVDGAMWKLEPDQIHINLVTLSQNGNDYRLYAVFEAIDDQGQLRTLAVPLIKK